MSTRCTPDCATLIEVSCADAGKSGDKRHKRSFRKIPVGKEFRAEPIKAGLDGKAGNGKSQDEKSLEPETISQQRGRSGGSAGGGNEYASVGRGCDTDAWTICDACVGGAREPD
jgi:hypothetical protein